ncbi:hypothetical protein ACIPY6_34410 [Streptomyces sp. NPDC090054]|uniref:hypothetical protein n=1 Tax=Streptomyces sp. NPDC090054 TaxID=3365933 RepID=UPI0037F78AEA
MKHVIRLSLALRSHWEEIKNHSDQDRGDISITTIIIWVAAVAGALAIAGTIGIVVTKYNTKLTGI